jgi:hypothetical protein
MNNYTLLSWAGGLLAFIVVCSPLIALAWKYKTIANLTSQNDTAMIGLTEEDRRKININTRVLTIWTAVFVTATTMLSMALFYSSHQMVAERIKPVSLQWEKKDSLKLKPGPAWFYYDKKSGTLNTLRTINDNDKQRLIGLLNDDDKAYYSYCGAIGELAYKSASDVEKNLYCWIILFYATSGLIGVQLRTINNFVGNVCHKNAFNFHRWWPWYLVRPLLGFITGGVAFLLIDGKQVLNGEITGGINTVVLAVAFLAGFATDDFYELLRKLFKRVFGDPNA